MLPGPVFNLELLTTARRARYYAVRVVYGMAILFVIFLNYNSWVLFRGSSTYSANLMSQFARSVFISFAGLQGVAILVMTPTLVSGVIVDEKQRKTLHYLLSSALSSAEIILGKLLARMIHVFVFIAIGLPIISLMSLFGGIDPILVLASELITISSAFFLAALSILVSTHARRVRDAMSAAYMLEAAWLFGPSLLTSFLGYYTPEVAAFLEVPLRWLIASGPMSLVWNARILFMGGPAILSEILWMVGIQVVLGSLMAWLAIVRLRPVFRAQADSVPRRFFGLLGSKKKSVHWRYFARPPVGDDAMIWKELHTSRDGGLRQIIQLGLLVIILGGLIIWAGCLGYLSFREMLANGYSMATNASNDRILFNIFLRITCTILCSLAALNTATVASNSITMEKESDTWTGLTTTPLDGEEIVRAKLLGAIWRSRPLLATAVFLWILGVLAGAVHPLGIVFDLIETTIFIAFASALGTSQSLRSKSSWRAQSMTMGILLFANAGYGFCCCPIAIGVGQTGATELLILLYAPCSPFIQGISLLSPGDFNRFDDSSSTSTLGALIMTCVIGTIGYAIAAFGLYRSTISRFDNAVGRAHRDGMNDLSIQRIAKKPVSDSTDIDLR